MMMAEHLAFFSFAGKDKAAKAAKAVKKSQWKKSRKPRYSVVFHRPRTLIRTRDPKVPRVRYVTRNGHYLDAKVDDVSIKLL